MMDQQIVARIALFLLSLLCDFRKGECVQDALVRLLEEFKICLDQGRKAETVWMDPSKAFNSIRRDLLIVKLRACAFYRKAT